MTAPTDSTTDAPPVAPSANPLRAKLSATYVRSTWFDRMQDATLRARASALHSVDVEAVLTLRNDCTARVFAAVQTGNLETIRETQLDVIALLDEVRAQAFSVIPVSDVKPFAEATIAAVQGTSEGMTAIATAGTTRRHGDVESACRSIHQMELANSNLVRSSERMLHQRRQA